VPEFPIDQNTVKKVQSELKGLNLRIQKKLVRQALRQVGKAITQVQKANVLWDDPLMRRAIKTTVKTYKRGKTLWMGAGVLRGKTVPETDWKFYVRAFGYNQGWRPYPKGKPTNRKGKNWRKGLRGQGGPVIYKTEYIDKGYRAVVPFAETIIKATVEDAVKNLRSANG